MKTCRLLFPEKLVLGLLLLVALSGPVRAQLAAIAYQGRLNTSGQPVGGFYDFRATLYDAPSNGSAIAGGDIEIGRRNAAILTVGFWNTAAGTHMNVVAKTFNPTSDRNAKQDFTPVDSAAILEKVVTLPMSEWAFKSETQTRHIGPMAQDFHAAFGVGPDDKHIATVDADGVALAAIQGLNQKLEDEVKSKDARIAELEHRLAALEAPLKK